MNAEGLFTDTTAQPSGSPIPPPRFRLGTRVVLPIALIGATVVLLIGAAWRSLFPGIPVDVVPVMVKTIEGTIGGSSVTATGWLEPDPYPVYAAALTSGTVAQILVLEGQSVSAGDPVAQLVDDDHRIALAVAKADLAMADGTLARARAEVSAEEERLETLIERRRASGASAAAYAAAEGALVQLTAEIAAQDAVVAALADEHARKEDLVASGAVSEGELRRLAIAIAGARAKRDAVRARRPQLEAHLEEARANRDAATEALELRIDERLGAGVARAELLRAEGAVARARAHRDDAALQLERTTIRAGVDGVVLRRLVSPGSRITMGKEEHAAHVIHIYDPAKLQVRVDVPLADAAAVGIEQAAEVTVSVLPEHRFSGRVTRMVHEADLQKNTVELKVAIEDPSPLLKPEMLARVRFLAEGGKTESRQRLLVPENAVIAEGGRSSVWVAAKRVDNSARAEFRPVELGQTRREGWIEVTAGVRPGDLIIAAPPAGLEPGDAVEITREENR